jgi:hypothetical protein
MSLRSIHVGWVSVLQASGAPPALHGGRPGRSGGEVTGPESRAEVEFKLGIQACYLYSSYDPQPTSRRVSPR